MVPFHFYGTPKTKVLGNRVNVIVANVNLVSLLYSAFIAIFGNQLYCIEKCVCVVM